MRIGAVVEALREWMNRFIGSWRVRARDQEFRAELMHHLAEAEARLIEQGHSPSEAARLARVRYGQAEQALEDLRRQQGIPWFGAFTLDVKLGLRMLRERFGLTPSADQRYVSGDGLSGGQSVRAVVDLRYGVHCAFSNETADEVWFEVVGVVAVVADRPAHPCSGSVFHPVDPASLAAVSIGFRTDNAGGQLSADLESLAAV